MVKYPFQKTLQNEIDVGQSINLMNQMIAQKVDAIVLAPRRFKGADLGLQKTPNKRRSPTKPRLTAYGTNTRKN